ncbi:Enoyl-CoA-hydratase [Methylobacterium cerastii]|uniref:Enoyl-CoA hydratase domain-containing protein 3, mitochondrial n=1 Tax=Methylobacterium cerastii TaxID=932741 RepID=A0ABQ4QN03_9HYPH|nr:MULTISPECIES: enoyl-CoA hydratase [Methylobacterium]TXM62270.1 enoyl-CoA hydratase [Methylobacterium sp. WL120]TXM99476.1 enoyl-CoA hydratase [Methylobacterium sp. WL122]TXN82801.1 enoyl-CoA hydratase [Methylobacterium sp. WL8]GJD46222.1 Enoyl-CoA-hydratase [Methylobacterium cerastii]
MSSTATQTARADAPLLLREDAGGIATLTLNRGPARNALSLGLMAALQDALDAIAEDRAVRVVVLRGAGPAFCAGHDLKEMRAHPGREAAAEVFRACSRLMLAITRLPQPVIAQVHGIATAAGCQLVATCDLAICADDARFATPGVNIGLFCSTPMVALSRAVPRKVAMEMLLLGEPVDAAEAFRIGLVNRVVPAADLDATVRATASRIAEKSARVLAIGKEAFGRQEELGLEEAYAYAAEVMTRNMMLAEAGEGIDAFLEKRTPIWPA